MDEEHSDSYDNDSEDLVLVARQPAAQISEELVDRKDMVDKVTSCPRDNPVDDGVDETTQEGHDEQTQLEEHEPLAGQRTPSPAEEPAF